MSQLEVLTAVTNIYEKTGMPVRIGEVIEKLHVPLNKREEVHEVYLKLRNLTSRGMLVLSGRAKYSPPPQKLDIPLTKGCKIRIRRHEFLIDHIATVTDVGEDYVELSKRGILFKLPKENVAVIAEPEDSPF